jgi:hypothetical protein
MDPGGIGAVVGISIMGLIGLSVCLYDKCVYRAPDEHRVTNPLIIKKRSFKVKDLFGHMEI